ncbi:vacuolar calcium ion transporter [Favolaschia claudopus]|uniref:Vacuolar calcium ion transporter n=1 Tax=Favolaschia claudopus TaxID=2862362 RepID=A0AAW0ED18_9AGAR
MSTGSTVVQRSSAGRANTGDDDRRIVDEEQGLSSGSNTRSPELNEKEAEKGRVVPIADRFLRRGRRQIGVVESLKAILFSSWLNLLLVFIPIAWGAHFSNTEHGEDVFKLQLTFVLCFLAIVPLEKLFEYGGEQMMFYLGEDLGELLIITLNNTVEATLAIILLTKCELKLLQATIIGVVILHLLLIPGVAFAFGGVRVLEQELHPHLTELNHTLLTIGVMTLLLPAAFFAASAHTGIPESAEAALEGLTPLVSDDTRHLMLQMSRGLAVVLLTVYICSRIFLHDPPGENYELSQHRLAPEALKERRAEFENSEPEVNQWVCIAMLAVTIGIMAATGEWLVDSIEFVREEGGIKQEWFGLILLPLVSFSGDGFLAVAFFIRSTFRWMRGQRPPPATLANARPIDMSIQFMMFWLPFIVLLGWWRGQPMSFLFDLFEVALVIASCFIVNYVTADAKTNWLEGYAMLAFYVMIAICSWFYQGQAEVVELSQCLSVEAALNSTLESILD